MAKKPRKAGKVINFSPIEEMIRVIEAVGKHDRNRAPKATLIRRLRKEFGDLSVPRQAWLRERLQRRFIHNLDSPIDEEQNRRASLPSADLADLKPADIKVLYLQGDNIRRFLGANPADFDLGRALVEIVTDDRVRQLEAERPDGAYYVHEGFDVLFETIFHFQQ